MLAPAHRTHTSLGCKPFGGLLWRYKGVSGDLAPASMLPSVRLRNRVQSSGCSMLPLSETTRPKLAAMSPRRQCAKVRVSPPAPGLPAASGRCARGCRWRRSPDCAAPAVRSNAIATRDADRGEGVPRGFDDDTSWSGAKHDASDRLRAGNDRTTARLLLGSGSRRPRGCPRRRVRHAQHDSLAGRPPGPRVPALAPPSPHAHTVGGFLLPERLSHGTPRFPPICVSVDMDLGFDGSERPNSNWLN